MLSSKLPEITIPSEPDSRFVVSLCVNMDGTNQSHSSVVASDIANQNYVLLVIKAGDHDLGISFTVEPLAKRESKGM